MKVENLNLVNLEGNSIVTSVELSDRKSGAAYFGMWYKEDATSSDVVGWCKSRIATYKRYIQNLQTLMGASQQDMVSGMSLEELKAIVAAKEQANS